MNGQAKKRQHSWMVFEYGLQVEFRMEPWIKKDVKLTDYINPKFVNRAVDTQTENS
jgi:hypothetical protein